MVTITLTEKGGKPQQRQFESGTECSQLGTRKRFQLVPKRQIGGVPSGILKSAEVARWSYRTLMLPGDMAEPKSPQTLETGSRRPHG
jgi:hypothetical protein